MDAVLNVNTEVAFAGFVGGGNNEGSTNMNTELVSSNPLGVVVEVAKPVVKVTSVEWRDEALKELRSGMFLRDTLKKLGARVRFVTGLPKGIVPANVMQVGYLHEDFIQAGRAFAQFEVSTYSYLVETPTHGHILQHNYVQNARLVTRWMWETQYKGQPQQHRGWNVMKVGFTDGIIDPTLMEQHPMMKGLHSVAAHNRSKPAVYGPSNTFSLCATPKFAFLAALLRPDVELLMQVPEGAFDWQSVLELGFQRELKVMSGEWETESKGQVAFENLVEIPFAGMG